MAINWSSGLARIYVVWCVVVWATWITLEMLGYASWWGFFALAGFTLAPLGAFHLVRWIVRGFNE